MEKTNINLLPTATRFQLSQIRLARKLKKTAFIFVGFWLFVVLVMLSLKTLISYRKKVLAAERVRVETALDQVSSQIGLQQSLVLRLKLAAEVISKRPYFSKRLTALFSLLPEDTELQRISIEAAHVKVSGQISSLSSLKEFEERIALARREKRYQAMEMTSLNSGKGKWAFSLEMRENPNPG